MTDIQPVEIVFENSRLLDIDRGFETYKNITDQTNYSFDDLIRCRLYDSTNQTIASWSGAYTYQNISQNGWFAYVSGVLTIPKSSYYYVSHHSDLSITARSWWQNFSILTWDLKVDLWVWRPAFTWWLLVDNNTCIVQLEKDDTITITRSSFTVGSTTVKSELIITEINPLAIVIK